MARIIEVLKGNEKVSNDRNKILSEIEKMKTRYKDPEFTTEISELLFQIRNNYPQEKGTSANFSDKIIKALNVYANSRDNYFNVFRRDEDLRGDCARKTNEEIFDEVKTSIEEVFGDTFVKYSIELNDQGKQKKLFKSREERESEKKSKELSEKIEGYNEKRYNFKFAILENQMKKNKLNNLKIMHDTIKNRLEEKAMTVQSEQENEKLIDAIDNEENEIASLNRQIMLIDSNITGYKNNLDLLKNLGDRLENNVTKTENGLIISEEEQVEMLSELDVLFAADEDALLAQKELRNSSMYYNAMKEADNAKQSGKTRERLEKMRQQRELDKLGSVGFDKEIIKDASKETK